MLLTGANGARNVKLTGIIVDTGLGVANGSVGTNCCEHDGDCVHGGGCADGGFVLFCVVEAGKLLASVGR